jgi:hypothetical protein
MPTASYDATMVINEEIKRENEGKVADNCSVSLNPLPPGLASLKSSRVFLGKRAYPPLMSKTPCFFSCFSGIYLVMLLGEQSFS